MTTHQTKKLKALIVVAASYAVQTQTLSEEAKKKLFQLYHPSIDTKGGNGDGSGNDEEKDAVKLATLALNCCKDMAASDSSLQRLVQDTNSTDELIKLLLIYSCNAFEGGRIYHEISRINHSCNPNAVVCEGKDDGDDGSSSSGDASVVKAACDIKANDEINISYLGKYLYAGYPTRQKVHKVCRPMLCTTSICGAKHWTTHFMNLSLIEESLANFHSTLMSMGQNASGDTDTMDELLTDIAEAADGIERAWKYARGLNLNIDPSHWLFDYTVGLARTLVGLGDEKSQKYASEWLTKVEDHAKAFESDAMNKVVTSLKSAWQRHSSTDEGEENSAKRQKVAK
ncbi:hypothetical protein ACHAWC_005463 [Mediolabrus comicus]